MKYKLISLRGLFSETLAHLELQSKAFHTNQFNDVRHYVLLNKKKASNIFMYKKHLLAEEDLKDNLLDFVETSNLKLIEIEIPEYDLESLALSIKDVISKSKEN